MKYEESENIYMNNFYKVLSKHRGKRESGYMFLNPIHKKPSEDEIDYSNEVMVRYFVQKSNSATATVYEVDSVQFNSLQKNPFYTCIGVLWKIKGNINTTESSDGPIIGVRDFNKDSTTRAKKRINNINLVLNNPLEFYKDI